MNSSNSDIIIYQSEDGLTRIQVRLEENTVWLTQAQMVALFQTTKQNISLHIQNIFEEGELKESSVVKENLTTAVDGKNYRIRHYNLDKDWIEVLDGFIKMNRQDVLTHAGKISAELAQEKALAEYDSYKRKSADELSEVEKQFIESIEQAHKQLNPASKTGKRKN